MLPTHKTPPKPRLSDLTILIYGKNKFGKCLSGNTSIVDPLSGRPGTIEALVKGSDGSVLTMKNASVIVPQRPSAYLANEPAQLFRLTTQTGRSIEATANHPFLTREGWKPLADLGVSSRVAVVAEYPQMFGHGDTDDELLKVFAYLIADGSIADNQSPVFTKNDPEVRMDFEAAVEAKGDECFEYVNDNGAIHIRVRGKQNRPNNVIKHLKEVGLHGLRSKDKFIPDFVFGLKKSKLRLFLNRLFTCDGSAEVSGRISYSSTSIRMVHQVQHLLSRFGIVSIIHNKYLEGALYGAELTVCSKANVLRYIDEIGFLGGKVARAESIRESLYRVREVETQLDRLGPVLFDRVLSIEATEIAPVYDLTIDDSHNFIANDFIVHNSEWCSRAEDALFLATEAGLNSLDVFQQPIRTWDDFLGAAKELADGKHAFRTVIIDTVDNAYRMCAEHICQKFKIEHESDLEYGKGYALINNEFYRVLNRLALLPYGLFLVSHSQEKEIETRTGKYIKVVPTLPDKARQIVLGMVDVILFGDLEQTADADGKPAFRRVLRTKPSTRYEAGDRTGRLPDVLDLDFAAFAAAFAQGVAAAAAPPTSQVNLSTTSRPATSQSTTPPPVAASPSTDTVATSPPTTPASSPGMAPRATGAASTSAPARSATSPTKPRNGSTTR